MKKLAAALLVLLVLGGAISALAAGGTSADPLVSLSYLTGTYSPDVLRKAQERIDAGTQTTYEDAAARLKAQADLYLARADASPASGNFAAAFTDLRFKRGDIVTVNGGSGMLLLAGSAALGYDSGCVVNVTAGAEVPSGSALAPDVRYLAAENTLCRLTVTSDTAVLSLQGYYSVAHSAETDYNALADALKAMGMFKGSDTGYGSGYDLEKPPTRIEGLIMFLRMLGEEEEALACTAPQPFRDVPEWCRSYVAYAYQMGYTKGVDSEKMLFGTTNKLAAWEYLTFLLRALGYQDGGTSPDFSWETALDSALAFGVISGGEKTLLANQTFLRAQTVYLSYYALDANTKAGGTLLDRLTRSGALDAQLTKSVRSSVMVRRIG